MVNKCPVCDGTGIVSRPPNVPGDQHLWSTSSIEHYPCRACGGTGLVCVDCAQLRAANETAEALRAQVDMLAGATRERDRLRSLYWETCKTCENECRNEDEWQKCYLKQQLDDAEKTYDAILSSLPSAGERWQAMERFIKDVECSYEAYASEAEDRPNELAVFRHVRQALDDFAKVVSE